MITLDLLRAVMPRAKLETLAPFAEPLSYAARAFAIDTPAREAMFVAQCAHESQEFTRLRENLNYSAQALMARFGKHFDNDDALLYARKPEQIANRVYANRLGNGDEASGDGWRYRGGGLIQITGKAAFAAFSVAVYGYSTRMLNSPELIELPDAAARSAAWYWWTNKLSDLADANDFATITRKINGSADKTLNGWESRVMYLGRAQEFNKETQSEPTPQT